MSHFHFESGAVLEFTFDIVSVFDADAESGSIEYRGYGCAISLMGQVWKRDLYFVCGAIKHAVVRRFVADKVNAAVLNRKADS